jgi:hypothetical protein
MDIIETVRTGETGNGPHAPSASLNSVTFTGEQVQSALTVLRCLPRGLQFDAAAQGIAIRDYVAATGIASTSAAPALHARIAALSKWAAVHDARNKSDAMVVLDAAATCPLIDMEQGLGFDPERFAETMASVAEMPW